jgi:UDP-N-acetylglucosamine pyrophosphorylase
MANIATIELYWLHASRKMQAFLFTEANNLGAIALASNDIYHSRTKHMAIDYHFIREKVLHKDILTQFISTIDQCANIFTKDFLPLGI